MRREGREGGDKSFGMWSSEKRSANKTPRHGVTVLANWKLGTSLHGISNICSLLRCKYLLIPEWAHQPMYHWFWFRMGVVSTLWRCLRLHPSSEPLTEPDSVCCCDVGPITQLSICRITLCWPLMLIKILLSFFTRKPKLEYNGSCVSISRVWAVSVIFCWSRQPLPCWPIRGQYWDSLTNERPGQSAGGHMRHVRD